MKTRFMALSPSCNLGRVKRCYTTIPLIAICRVSWKKPLEPGYLLFEDDNLPNDKPPKQSCDDSGGRNNGTGRCRGSKRGRFRRGGNRGRQGLTGNNNKDDKKDDKSAVVFYHCDKPGHKSPDCRSTHHRDGYVLPPLTSRPKVRSINRLMTSQTTKIYCLCSEPFDPSSPVLCHLQDNNILSAVHCANLSCV